MLLMSLKQKQIKPTIHYKHKTVSLLCALDMSCLFILVLDRLSVSPTHSSLLHAGVKISSGLCPTSSLKTSFHISKTSIPKVLSPTLIRQTGINDLICSTHFAELHGDIMLQVLGSFRPRLFTATLQAVGKLLENGHSARHDGGMLGLWSIKSCKFFRKRLFLLLSAIEISELLS